MKITTKTDTQKLLTSLQELRVSICVGSVALFLVDDDKTFIIWYFNKISNLGNPS